MSTGLKLVINSDSSVYTENLGQKIGNNLKGGEIVQLASDLGGGKTTFVRGLARGSKSNDVVASPTFTISKAYKSPHFNIYHFDFYRLNEPGLMKYELEELIEDRKDVVVVEWADNVKDILPIDTLNINIAYDIEDTRIIEIEYNNKNAYLLEGLL
ncbi:tRNA (adenosine(37)-N6)-threonylcarbamoyltransferase complex ATPase subunit type 1 TsaE [Candidatus Saccharibacteria bacterium]|jgi:tRNA threonylcarbamoyladenosine biosynthesis protein TsaE|nr:tRNA (adenosine(37)-N6)-threonylcarbamoyltransferase complex ATPase subunit type 1 TsaE [Candidatus Saccharibacteria bacterium]